MNHDNPAKGSVQCNGQSVFYHVSYDDSGQWGMTSSDFIAFGKSKYCKTVLNCMFPKDLVTLEEAKEEAERKIRRIITQPNMSVKYESHSMREMRKEIDHQAALDHELYATSGYTDEEINDFDSEGLIDDFGNLREE